MTVLCRPSLTLPFARGVWDPRLSLTRASVATYVDRQGLLRTAAANTPRLDHDPMTGECLGLLVEESRTNLVTRSEAFDDAAWTKAGVSVLAGSATAPDGTTTADEIVEDTESGSHSVRQTVSHAPGPLTASLFVRPGAKEGIRLQIYNATDGTIAYVDANLSTGSIISSAGAVNITALSNDWYFLTCTGNATASLSTVYAFLLTVAESVDTTYVGDGTSGLYIWGAQLEEGSFPTSYIPTTDSTATRAADVCVLGGDHFAEVWNPAEGTTVVGFRPGLASGNQLIVHIDDDTNNNSHKIYRSSDGRVFLQTSISGTSEGAFVSADPGAYQRSTAAYAFAEGDFAGTINGHAVQVDPSRDIPTVTTLRLGSAVSIFPFTGHIASLALYPHRLDNATLQTLTG